MISRMQDRWRLQRELLVVEINTNVTPRGSGVVVNKFVINGIVEIGRVT